MSTPFKDIVITCSARMKIGLEDEPISVTVRVYEDNAVVCHRSKTCPIWGSARDMCPALTEEKEK